MPHTSAAIRSRLSAAVTLSQLLFMALYLEAGVLFREIHARQRMDTKPNPRLEAVYFYCSNSVAVLLLAPALCMSSQHSTKNSVVGASSFSLSLMLTIWLQHVENEKSRQEKKPVPQALLKKKGCQGSRTRKASQL